jgi:hypothetical protein
LSCRCPHASFVRESMSSLCAGKQRCSNCSTTTAHAEWHMRVSQNEPSATISSSVTWHVDCCARARGDGTGRKRGAKVNWPPVCLSPAGSHGNGLSCVPHANIGVLSNMSDVGVQVTVSFIITFRKKNVASDIISSVADRLGSFPCGTASHLAVVGAFALPRVPGR